MLLPNKDFFSCEENVGAGKKGKGVGNKGPITILAGVTLLGRSIKWRVSLCIEMKCCWVFFFAN